MAKVTEPFLSLGEAHIAITGTVRAIKKTIADMNVVRIVFPLSGSGHAKYWL
ncbi:hypothetical protein M1B72_16785 [Geomonas paludis]|uniref:Uncharacterized protein n=1 Tax=Geomonas paludis TaxID=2740185 RepID=A0ABY4LF02_9BACT|nr:hypothetical protein [Geomonas paludis]UPU35093.1 hypothetical protein M1B72_16785 [Geomonas paludis]